MDISGAWSFELDAADQGLAESWWKRSLSDTLTLPGSLQEQGFGPPVSVETEWTGSVFDSSWFTEERYARYREAGHVKVPFWLQPDRHYQGVAWYQHEVQVSPEWQGQRVVLTLERPHWETRLWLDDQEIGSNNSLSAPHVYDLGTVIPGTHRLTIRIDNRILIEVGPNAHSVSDHTQTNWNGIAGRLELSAGSPAWIDEVQIYPQIADRSITVRLRLGSQLKSAAQTRLTLAVTDANGNEVAAPLTQVSSLPANGADVELRYVLGDDAQLWDEFHPNLYQLTATLEARVDEVTYRDQQTTTFGLREIAVQGTQLALNGKTIFIRGTLECCIFPLTGYPPTEVEPWKRIIRIAKAHGLNHIRFHSYCPPEAAFIAADELGFYYQVECAAWANQGATIGEGKPLDSWLYEEAKRIIAAYGNHPSFIMMAYGNEPSGKDAEYLAKWVSYWKEHEPRRVHTSGAGWPAIPENNYHNIPAPRVQAWGEELNSRINGRAPETTTDYSDYVERMNKPIVSHEIGQWCVYPNFDEMPKYTGYLKPKNFEIFQESLNEHHMGDQAHAFLMASGKLQALCYKEDIESALRTPGFAGFHLLDLHDFPGQGTALVGVLDPFWDEKGYISADEYRRFCNSTVLLARLEKRYWSSSETLTTAIDVAHFGPEPLAQAEVIWKLVDESGAAVANGSLPPRDIAIGNGQHLGTLSIELASVPTAQRYSLVTSLADGSFENDWALWIFADELAIPESEDVLVTSELDAALARLAEGGTVVLLAPPSTVRVESIIGFSSVFWNTAWTNNQAPHTLGILCDPAHAALSDFPTTYHSDWQWWELIHGSAALVLDGMPAELRPLVQPIDTWFENRRLGLLVEATVGSGKLLLSSMDLQSDLNRRLVARQMRYSLMRYASSEAFAPRCAIEPEALRALFSD